MDSITVGTDLLVGSEKILGALVMGGLVLGALEITAASGAVAEGNGSGELRAVEEWVRTISDTGWVVAALVVIRERAPLGACVDNAISENESTVAADHVAGRELLNEVWWKDLAVLADHLHVEVLDIRVLSPVGWGNRGRHLWLIRLLPDIDVSSLLKNALR